MEFLSSFLASTANGNVEAKVVCFYRRRDISNTLIVLADKHAREMEEEMENSEMVDLPEKQKHQLRHRELFLSRQLESLPATHIRGKCSVTLLNETESLKSYLEHEHKDVAAAYEQDKGSKTQNGQELLTLLASLEPLDKNLCTRPIILSHEVWTEAAAGSIKAQSFSDSFDSPEFRDFRGNIIRLLGSPCPTAGASLPVNHSEEEHLLSKEEIESSSPFLPFYFPFWNPDFWWQFCKAVEHLYDPQQKTLLADKGEIRVGNKYQADIIDLLKEGEDDGRDQSDLETKVWGAFNPLIDKQIDQFLVVARSVGTFARVSRTAVVLVRKPSLHMMLQLLGYHTVPLMDTLHKKNVYDISMFISGPCTSQGGVLCRDEMEEWSASEANLFEEALEKYGKDFTDIQQDFLPWKSLTSIIEILLYVGKQQITLCPLTGEELYNLVLLVLNSTLQGQTTPHNSQCLGLWLVELCLQDSTFSHSRTYQKSGPVVDLSNHGKELEIKAFPYLSSTAYDVIFEIM
uniref:Uncharacterized protein n=1 Tax=Sphaerodactylus townsendi TaxID=933632 RepID=A0ACB8EBB4_9SAUR